MNINFLASVELLECLHRNKGATIKDIMEFTGLCRNTVSKWVNGLYDHKPNLVYIHQWKQHGDNWTPYWRFGRGVEDALRPPPKTRAQQDRLYRENKRIREGRGTPAMAQALTKARRIAVVNRIPRDPVTQRFLKTHNTETESTPS